MATRIDLPAAFLDRHLGPDRDDVRTMLEVVGYPSLEALTDAVVPESIRFRDDLDLPAPVPESELLDWLRERAGMNRMRPRRIGLVEVAWRAPLTATRALRPRWVNVPTNLRRPARLQLLPGDFAATPCEQDSP